MKFCNKDIVSFGRVPRQAQVALVSTSLFFRTTTLYYITKFRRKNSILILPKIGLCVPVGQGFVCWITISVFPK